MAKIEQALILEPPSELHFKAPFTDITTSYITLTNPTEREICFKVKTTAPKTYCVRPNGGTIQPKKTVKVAVMLQPFDLETTDKTRHKFMVQSIYAPDGEYNFETLWRDTSPENFMNSKLKCVFDMPVETSQVSEGVEVVKVEVKTAQIQEATPKRPDAANEAIQKAQHLNKQLKNELSELRQENSTLKEEGLRSRMAFDTRSRGTSARPTETSYNLHSTPAKQQLHFSNYLIAAVVVFLCGIYLGKSFF